MDVFELLVELGAVRSNNEARRLLRQGAVKINGRKLSSDETRTTIEEGALIEVGKKKAYKFSVTGEK